MGKVALIVNTVSPYHITSGQAARSFCPITEDEAKEWVEDYLDGDDYEKLWPVVEDDSKKTTSIMLSSDAYDKLKKMSADKGLSMSQIIEGMVLDLSAD